MVKDFTQDSTYVESFMIGLIDCELTRTNIMNLSSCLSSRCLCCKGN